MCEYFENTNWLLVDHLWKLQLVKNH